MKTTTYCSLGALVLGLCLSTVVTSAQGAGGRGNFDPEEMRARMAERMKTQLKADDAEWKVIQPLLEDVQEKQRAALGGRFGGMMGMMAGPRGGGPQNADNANAGRRGRGMGQQSSAVQALAEAVESGDASASDLKSKMKAVREEREKAAAALKTAREKLRHVLTTQQEAQLVLMGVLD